VTPTPLPVPPAVLVTGLALVFLNLYHLTMTTIIIKRDDAPTYQTKTIAGAAAFVRGADDWRAACDCGWVDKFGSEREAFTVSAHHNSSRHDGKAFVLKTTNDA
jgi:hypothetical protein